MRSKSIKVGDTHFSIPELGEYGYSVGIRQWKENYDRDHIIVQTAGCVFDKKMFSKPHIPLAVSEICNQRKFSQRNHLRVLDCPIKFPNSDYRIPKELHQFDEVLSKMVAFEHRINKYVSQYYAYLTVDQGEVSAHQHQRKTGCHVDGFQGARVEEKRPIGRSYIAYDCIPTIFYPQSFVVSHLDEKTDNFFLSFDEQADPTTEIFFDPYKIICINPYVVHRSDQANQDTYRTFLRLSYDLRRYDRYGNTHNPLFDYQWAMIVRETERHLRFKPLLGKVS